MVLSRDENGIFYQGPKMTQLIKRAFEDHPWDFILPLDSDEFLRVSDRAALEAMVANLGQATIGLSDVVTYIPTQIDDPNEKDVLRRVVHLTKTVPDVRRKIGKVIIPGGVVKQSGFALNEGHHGVFMDGRLVPERRIDGLSLAHFPVRSISQFTMQAIMCRLAWSSRADYNPSWGWNYGMFIEKLKVRPVVSAADLTDAALLYVDIYARPEQTPYQKMLVREPMVAAYEELRFTSLIDVAVLPPILDMMDVLIGELREARAAAAARSCETSVAAVRGSRVRLETEMEGGE